MKKTLVAVAALAAVTGAMAEATFGGAVDMAIVSQDNDGVKSTSMYGATNEFSNIYARSSEDLGNGMKAEAFIDLGLYNRAGGAQFTRELYVGISGDFGGLRLGRQLTPLFLAAATNEVNGAPAAAGGLEGVIGMVLNQGVRDARRDNTLIYRSPSINGISVNAQSSYSVAGVTGAGTGYGISYANGPFAAQYQYESTADEGILDYIANGTAGAAVAASAASDKTTRTVAALSYDLGMATVKYMHPTASHNEMTQKGDYVGVSIPMNAFTVTASYYKSSSTDNADVTSTASGNLMKINYALSKRTNVYAIYGKDTFTTLDATLTTTSFGLSHSF